MNLSSLINRGVSASLPRQGLFLAIGLAVFGATSVNAQTVFWSSSAVSAYLSNGANWVGASPPANGSNVEFDGGPGTNLYLDTSGVSLNLVTFGGSADYVLTSNPSGNTLTLNGGGTSGITETSPLTNTVSVPVSLGGNVAVDVANVSAYLVVNGVVSGSGKVTLTGPGTVQLTGANTYTGGTTISSGTLAIGNGSAIGSAIIGDVTNNGVLQYSPASTDTITYSGVISGTGSVVMSGLGTIILSGANTYSGVTYVNGGTLSDGAANSFSQYSDMLVNSAGGHLAVLYNETVANLENGGTGGLVGINTGVTLITKGDNYSGDFEGTISGAGKIEIASGVQGLAGENAYSGGTTVDSGAELFVGSSDALGTGTLTLAGGSEFSTDVDFVGLSNPITLNGTVDNEDGSGNMTLTGKISGPGEIEWCTPGTLTLTNSLNDFTGGVDMREGVLVVANNNAVGLGGTIIIDSGAVVNINSGVTLNNPLNFTGSAGVLSGNGTLGSTLTTGSGTVLSPSAGVGGGPGQLSFTSGLTIGSGTAIHFAVYDANGSSGTGYSSMTVTGGLAFTASPSTITFNLVSTDASGNSAAAINFDPNNPYSWKVATSDSMTGFNPNMFTLDTSGFLNGVSPSSFTFSEAGGTDLYLNFTPVPEPSTWALIGVGLVALVPMGMRRGRLLRA